MLSVLNSVKDILRKTINFCGYEIFKKKEAFHYAPNIYGKSFAKQIDFRTDLQFSKIAKQVIEDGRACLYYDRLHIIYQSIIQIIQQFSRDAKMNFIEVGVFKGGGSFFIASVIQELQVPNVNLFCVDTFDGHSELDVNKDFDGAVHQPGFFSNTNLASVEQYLKPFNNVTIIKNRIQDAAPMLRTKQFHFVHLDVDIVEPTCFGLNFFIDRMQPGGIIVVDDYGFDSCPGVKKAVDTFWEKNANRCVRLHIPTGQCVLVITG